MLENFDMTVIKATAMSMAFVLVVGNIIINFIIKNKKEELRDQLRNMTNEEFKKYIESKWGKKISFCFLEVDFYEFPR